MQIDILIREKGVELFLNVRGKLKSSINFSCFFHKGKLFKKDRVV